MPFNWITTALMCRWLLCLLSLALLALTIAKVFVCVAVAVELHGGACVGLVVHRQSCGNKNTVAEKQQEIHPHLHRKWEWIYQVFMQGPPLAFQLILDPHLSHHTEILKCSSTTVLITALVCWGYLTHPDKESNVEQLQAVSVADSVEWHLDHRCNISPWIVNFQEKLCVISKLNVDSELLCTSP